MKIKIYPHELIGENIRIERATNSTLVGIEGEIIDETKSTLVVKTTKGDVTVLKTAVQEMTLLGKGVTLSGERVAKRPEERIKGK